MDDLELARKQWIKDLPRYEKFGKLLKSRLEILVRRAGIAAETKARTKDIDSLVKKLILKPHHTYGTLPDKVGLRIVATSTSDLRAIRSAVDAEFRCEGWENKADKLGEDHVGYRSWHADLCLRDADEDGASFPPATFRAELQLRTLGQNLWSEMAHGTTYKGYAASPELKRRLNLLAGLIEVADNEFERITNDLAESPGAPELRILQALEKQYFKFTSRRGNGDLSLNVIRLLWPLYKTTPEEVCSRITNLVETRRNVLTAIFDSAEAAGNDRGAFFFQPEVLLIYAELEDHPFALRSTWATTFPIEELDRVANRFGQPADF